MPYGEYHAPYHMSQLPYEQKKRLKAIVWYYAPLCDKPVSIKQLQRKIGKELDLWFTYDELFQHLHSWQETTQSFEPKRFLKRESR